MSERGFGLVDPPLVGVGLALEFDRYGVDRVGVAQTVCLVFVGLHRRFEFERMIAVVTAGEDRRRAEVGIVAALVPHKRRLVVIVSERSDRGGLVSAVLQLIALVLAPVLPEEVILGFAALFAEVLFGRHHFDLGRVQRHRLTADLADQGHRSVGNFAVCVLGQRERGFVGLVFIGIREPMTGRRMLPFERLLVLVAHAAVLRRRAIGSGGGILASRAGVSDLGHFHFDLDDVRRIVRTGQDQVHAVVPAVLIFDPVVRRLIVVSRRGDGDGHVFGVFHDPVGIPEQVILGFGILAEIGVPRHPLDLGRRDGLRFVTADAGQGQARRRDFPPRVLCQSERGVVGLLRVEVGILMSERRSVAECRPGIFKGLAVQLDRRPIDHVGVRVAGRIELVARHLRLKLDRVVGVMRAGKGRRRAEILAVTALDPIERSRVEVSEGGQDLRRFVEELAVLVVRRSVIGRKAVVFAIGLGINRFGDGRGNGQRIFAEETFKGYFGVHMILAPRPDGVVEIVEGVKVVQHPDLGRRRHLSADQQREIEVAGLVELETEFGELLDPVAGEDHVAALVGGGDGEAFPVGKPYALDDDEDLVPLVPSR